VIFCEGINTDLNNKSVDNQWNRMFFAFSLIIEGATERVLQFIMPLKPICNRNFGFIEQKVFLNNTESFKQVKLY